MVRMASPRWTDTAAPSGLALQDVFGKGLQFGRPVHGGRRRPQDELREPDCQPLVDPFVQGRAALRDEVRGAEAWTPAPQLLNCLPRQGPSAVLQLDAEVHRSAVTSGPHR